MIIKNNSKGFTLIELLVVISILGTLSSVILASLNRARVSARDAKRIAEVNEMRKAVEIYYSNHSSYPPINQVASIANGWSDFIGYMRTDNLLSKIEDNIKPETNFLSFLLPLKTIAAVGTLCPPNLRPQDPECECKVPNVVINNPVTRTYGYMSSTNQGWQRYKIRARLENTNHPILGSGVGGDFAVLNDAGCNPASGYYCIGHSNLVND